MITTVILKEKQRIEFLIEEYENSKKLTGKDKYIINDIDLYIKSRQL